MQHGGCSTRKGNTMDDLILYDTDPNDPFLIAEAAATVALLTLDTGNAIASVTLGVDEVHRLRDWLSGWLATRECAAP